MYPNIIQFIEEIDISNLSQERIEMLQPLCVFLQKEIANENTIHLNFICTHNSRRSHLGQIWAAAMATYYGFGSINTYSGGTEATAIYKSVLSTLLATGFEMVQLSEESNPVIAIKMGQAHAPIIAFSKKYDHPFNPQSQFVAIMTCDHADDNCPIVRGAIARFPVKYVDPKISDGTIDEPKVYQLRSYQIAQEMKYVFSNLGSEIAR